MYSDKVIVKALQYIGGQISNEEFCAMLEENKVSEVHLFSFLQSQGYIEMTNKVDICSSEEFVSYLNMGELIQCKGESDLFIFFKEEEKYWLLYRQESADDQYFICDKDRLFEFYDNLKHLQPYVQFGVRFR